MPHRHVLLGGNGGSSTMSRSSYSHLWRLGLMLAGFAATPATWADPLSAVEVLRAGGCGGVMPAAQPLRHNPMLDRAAAEWALGQSLPLASERNGYRGDFTAGLHITGPDFATLQLLRRSGCRLVAGREMRDIGMFRRGPDSWIVVASVYRLPPGMQASAGTAMPPLLSPPASGRGATPTPPPSSGWKGPPPTPAPMSARVLPPQSPPPSSWDNSAIPAPALPAAPAVARALPPAPTTAPF